MMKRLIYMTVATFAFVSCQQQNGKEETDGGFETMAVAKQDITLHEAYPAQIEGRQSVRIIPRVEGYLREIRVKEGQQVRRGEVLFVIDQAAYQAEVKAAEANVAVAKAGVETASLRGEPRRDAEQLIDLSRSAYRTIHTDTVTPEHHFRLARPYTRENQSFQGIGRRYTLNSRHF